MIFPGIVFLICYLVSRFRGSYLSHYIHEGLIPQLCAGIYDGLVYWLTLWLILTAALISAYGIFESFAEQKAREHSLTLKNSLQQENYKELKKRAAENAAI